MESINIIDKEHQEEKEAAGNEIGISVNLDISCALAPPILDLMKNGESNEPVSSTHGSVSMFPSNVSLHINYYVTYS
jgi:hypothetical protein